MKQVLRTIFILGVFVLGIINSIKSQQNFLPGFAGLKCGSQSNTGIYGNVYAWGMHAKSVVDRKGQSFTVANGDGLFLRAPTFGIVGVTKKKIFGGNYGYSILGSLCNSRLELLRLDIVNHHQPYGFTSTYVQPINLGWNTSWADFIAGYAVYLPTGRWKWLGKNNYGLGMWTQELNLGTTIYLDSKKKYHLALEVLYDINSKKKGVSYRTGWPITLQGGLGANFGNPNKLFSGWFGVTGFAQWITVRTKFNSDLGLIDGPYARVFGLGPQLVVLKGLLSFQYLWEFGAKSNYEGPIWCITLNFSIWKPKNAKNEKS